MLNYEYPPLGGGGGVAAANIAEELVRLGHEVDYVTSHCEGLEREETIGGVRIYREPVVGRKDLQTASIVSMLSYPLAAVRRAVVLRRSGDYDVIHTHFAIPSGPAGFVVSKLWRTPNILSVYGGDIYDPSKKYSPHRHPVLKIAVKRVLNQASAIVAESKDLLERTVSIYRPKSAPCCIPLGFKKPNHVPVSRAMLGMEDGMVYAVAVSRLVARKGYPDLLRSFAACDAPQLRLIIVGDGPEGPALRALCSELNITERVRFFGQATEEEKYGILGNADFFALATHHEGYGIVYQEAMYCGLPIVTTNVGGQTDFLAHGENALLCAPGDLTSLTRHLARMANDAPLRATMSKKNRADIQGHLIDNVVKAYLDLFKQHLPGGAT